MTKTKRKSKTIHIKITPELLIEAFLETLYFNKSVERVRIVVSRFKPEVPTQDVFITCSGRGRIKGKIVNGVFHGTIYGTERDIKRWQKFFSDFIEEPGFKLMDYIEWLRQNNQA